MTTPLHTDIAVIGGGPAGLQAALTAGRVRRQVTLFDDGTYRNATVSHMHNVLTHDGTPPAEFRAAARRELTAYDTVSVREERVATVERDGEGFRLTLASGEILTSYAVVLATGVRDELPPVPGLQEVWGDLAADPGLAPLGRVLARAERSGAPVAAVVERLADDLAETGRAEVEQRARTVGVRAAVPLGLCLLPAFLLLGIVPLVASLVAGLEW